MLGKLILPLIAAAGLAAAPAPADAEVIVIGEAILAPAGFEAAPVPVARACSDTAYALSGWKLTSTYKWSYNPAGAPAPVASTALAATQAGSQSLVTGQNRCGTATNLTTTQQYLGTTTRAAQIGADGSCQGNDGQNVTSWGSLPASYLAYTCVYYRPTTHAVLSSDMLIDNRYHQWFTAQPANCSNAYDLQAVVVHERGHTAGLAHVDQATHGTATMSPRTNPCDTSKRALAAGDLRGMQSLYSR